MENSLKTSVKRPVVVVSWDSELIANKKLITGERREQRVLVQGTGTERKYTFLRPLKAEERLNPLHNNQLSNIYRYVCLVCWRSYMTDSRLLNHSNMCHGSISIKDFTSATGQYTVLNKNLTNLPIVKLHPLRKTYLCGGCSFETTERSNIAHHVQTHTNKIICTSESNTQDELSEAPVQVKKAHFGSSLIRCTKCPYSTNCYSIYSQHILKHVEQAPRLKLLPFYKNRKCDNNKDVVSQRRTSNRARQVIQPSSKKPCKCAHCSLSNIHSDCTSNASGNAPISLSPCNYQTAYRIFFNRYLMLLCGRTIRNSLAKRGLTANSSRQPPIALPQKSKCENKKNKDSGRKSCKNLGNRRVPFKTRKIESYKTKNSSELFACPTCSYRTHRKFMLKMHIMVHDGIRPIKCPLCPFACIWKGNLTKHMKVHHSGIKTLGNLKYPKSSDKKELEKKVKKSGQHSNSTFMSGKVNKHVNLDHSGEVKLPKLTRKDSSIASRSSGTRVKVRNGISNDDSSVSPKRQIRKIQSPNIKNSSEKSFLACPMCSYQTHNRDVLKRHIMVHNGIRPIKCPVCPYACIWNGNLTKHIRAHHSGDKRVGKIKSLKSSEVETFNKKLNKGERSYATTRGGLNEQIKLEHSEEVNLPTLEHSAGSNDSKSSGLLVEDGNEISNKDSLVCPHCSFKALQRGALNSHMTIHADSKPYKCDKCMYTTMFKSNIHKHLCGKVLKVKGSDSLNTRASSIEVTDGNKNSQKDLLFCPDCNFVTRNKRALTRHMIIHSDKKSVCRKKSYYTPPTTKISLKKHGAFENCGRGNDSKPKVSLAFENKILSKYSYVCPHCSFKSSNKVSSNNHKIIHSREKQYKCKLCPYKSFWEFNLRTHMRSKKHSTKDVKPLLCKQCSYTSPTEESLKKHIKSQHSKRNIIFKSTSSDPSYSAKPSIHNKRFKKKPTLTCPHCEYFTPTESFFKRHLMIHSGERPLKCPHCTYACIWEGNLTKHIVSRHCGNRKKQITARCERKPHTCSQCTYRGTTKSKLAKHMVTHDKTTLYSCHCCDLKFIRQGNLIAHIRRIHKSENLLTFESNEPSSNHDRSSLLFVKYSYQPSEGSLNAKLNDSMNQVLSKSQECSDHTYAARP